MKKEKKIMQNWSKMGVRRSYEEISRLNVIISVRYLIQICPQGPVGRRCGIESRDRGTITGFGFERGRVKVSEGLGSE